MLFKKTLVLSSPNGGNEKAVVNFEKEDGEIVGETKLYNVSSEPDGILSLGVKENQTVHKAGLIRIGAMKYRFKFSFPLDLQEFSCAIININHGKVSALCSGSTSGSQTTDEILAQAVLEMDNAKNMEQCEEILNEKKIELEDQEEIEKEIDSCIKGSGSEKCTLCKYRHAFYCTEQEKEPANESFFDGISDEITKLFSTHEEEDLLKQIIPNSKWVKVENSEDDTYYVLGLIYENDVPKYICYGVPGMYTETPPKELNGYAEWLPIDSTNEQGYGYYITYQDAKTGENVKADFEVV